MKKTFMLLCALQCLLLSSCNHNDRDISFSYKDSRDTYSMTAWFSKTATRKIELYMDQKLGDKNNFSFINTETDATLTLDDGSKFYMKKHAGYLGIKMDKTENSVRAYRNLKDMCEGMKDVVLK